VQPCCGAVPRMEEPVELSSGRPLIQRKGSLALLGETRDQPRQSGRHLDEFWTRRDLQKSAVHIKEHSGLEIKGRRWVRRFRQPSENRLCALHHRPVVECVLKL